MQYGIQFSTFDGQNMTYGKVQPIAAGDLREAKRMACTLSKTNQRFLLNVTEDGHRVATYFNGKLWGKN
jgi:hypothetical protein